MDDKLTYRQQIKEEFIQALNKLVGLNCIEFNTQEYEIQENKDDKGYVSLHFASGEMELRKIPAFTLVIPCLWRMETSDTVIATFTGSKGGILNKHSLPTLRQYIVGNKVKNVEIFQPSCDLKLEFTDKYIIHIIVGGMKSYVNYRLFDNSEAKANHHSIFDVEENGQVDCPPRLLPE